MSFDLLLLFGVLSDGRANYSTIGTRFETKKEVESAKRSYSFARSGVVKEAREKAKTIGLRSPWLIEERKNG